MTPSHYAKDSLHIWMLWFALGKAMPLRLILGQEELEKDKILVIIYS